MGKRSGDRYSPPVNLAVRLVLIAALFVGCGRPDPSEDTPRTSESDYRVKRLREDTELELQDLRGRWLAAEALLTKQRSSTRALEQRLDHSDDHLERTLAEMTVELGALRAEVEVLRSSARPADGPSDSVLDRLAASYEEIYCLRRQGAEEAVGSVYRRYGFDGPDEWGAAWQQAARNEAFERRVSTRVERLCP